MNQVAEGEAAIRGSAAPAGDEGTGWLCAEEDEESDGSGNVGEDAVHEAYALKECLAHGPLNVQCKGDGLFGMTRRVATLHEPTKSRA